MEITSKGFTLVELIIVIAIIGVVMAFAVPSYQDSVRKTKRMEAQAEMVDIAASLQKYKMANFHYVKSRSGSIVTPIDLQNVGFASATPKSNNGSYQYGLSFNSTATEWTLTATPIVGGQLAGTGALTVDHAGQRCWYKDTFTKGSDICLPWDGK